MSLSSGELSELRTTARSLLVRKSAPGRVRQVVADAPGFDRDLWDQMVDLGWTSIHVPARQGGAGCGNVELGVVLYELGRAITPSPFLASAVLATGALCEADNEVLAGDLLGSLVDGTRLGTVAMCSSTGSYDLSRLSTTWAEAGDSIRLDGCSGFVLDADVADILFVVAGRAGVGPAVVVLDASTPGVRVERAATVDATRRLFSVSYDNVVVGPDRYLCEPGADAARLFDHVLALGVIAACCDAAGVADQVLERSAAYAKERTQFGKPIGTFQAVKHLCADMAIAVEGSRAATQAAAKSIDEAKVASSITAAITSSYVGPACSEACGLGLRVHGGIGFTWEEESHLYLKRAKLDEVLFGSPSWHRRRLADAVFPPLASR